MRDACKAAVERALGRPLSAREIAHIEQRVAAHMRLLARQDPQAWAGKSEPERLQEAADRAAAEVAEEARRRNRGMETRVLRMRALQDFIETQVKDGRDTLRIAAADRILAGRADLGGAPEGGSVDLRANGGYNLAVAQMADLFQAGKRRGIWRYIPVNEPGVNRALRRALAGETKDVAPEFVRLAKLAHDTIDLLVRRFNAAGGAIGRLEDWGEPHHWSPERLLRAIKRAGGGAAGVAAVAREFAAAAERSKYVREDGAAMSPADIEAFMTHALTSIISDGANKRLAGDSAGYAASLTANRHRAHREIHLRADAIAAMLDKYSEMGAMDSLLRHIRQLNRDIALIETFGPNADLSAEQLINRAADADLAAFPDEARKREIIGRRDAALGLYKHLSGQIDHRQNRLSSAMAALRSWVAYELLGFTTIASLTDPLVMHHVAGARGLDQFRVWVNDVAVFAGQDRLWAKKAGLLTEMVAGYADRFNADYLSAPDIGAKAASLTLKATGLNWVTEARRAGYGMTMMNALGDAVASAPSLETLKHQDDRAFLRALNISDDTYAVWRLAKLETVRGNHTLLSPQAIFAIDDAALEPLIKRRAAAINQSAREKIARIMATPEAMLDAAGKQRAADAARAQAGQDVAALSPDLIRHDAATQLLGIIRDEINTAIVTAGAREHAAMAGAEPVGTFGGELRRSVIMFHSFPWTFLTRQMELAKTIDGGGNRFRYAASLLFSTWAMGIVINWLYDLGNGRDPGAINPNSAEGWRNIIAGLARGGGLGVFGDFFFANADPSGRTQSLTATMAGPVPAKIDELQQLTLGNLNQAATGQDPNFGPELARSAVTNVLPNWWMTKMFRDYLLETMQEELEPGYNARREANAFRARGTTYWRRPGQSPLSPERAPDLSRAFEGDMPETAH